MEKPLCGNYPPDLKVIETFRVDHGRGLRLPHHLARLERTCRLLGLVPRGVSRCLSSLPEDGVYRARLTVALDGQAEIGWAPLAPTKPVWKVAISPHRLDSSDPWLQIKTTQRALYDAERQNLPPEIDEWVFLNEAGDVCEGTISNIFAGPPDALRTPPQSAGLLPGILRETLLETGQAQEATLRPEDLAKPFWVGNSLRGLIPAELVAQD